MTPCHTLRWSRYRYSEYPLLIVVDSEPRLISTSRRRPEMIIDNIMLDFEIERATSVISLDESK